MTELHDVRHNTQVDTPQAGRVAAVLAIAAAVAAIACESPARVKPWRHAPDPTAEAEHVPHSRALDAEHDDAGPRPDRSHTLRIDVDADPGRLSPLVSPSVWARRITLGTVFEPLLRYQPRRERRPRPHLFAPRLAKQLAGDARRPRDPHRARARRHVSRRRRADDVGRPVHARHDPRSAQERRRAPARDARGHRRDRADHVAPGPAAAQAAERVGAARARRDPDPADAPVRPERARVCAACRHRAVEAGVEQERRRPSDPLRKVLGRRAGDRGPRVRLPARCGRGARARPSAATSTSSPR